MDLKKPQSKTPSDTKSTPPDSAPIYFLEESLGSHLILTALRESGIQCTTVSDLLRRGTPDEEWLEFCGRENLIAISKDKKIRYSPLSLIAIDQFRVRLFILSEGNLSAQEIIQRVRASITAMNDFIKSNEGPFIVKVYRGGKIRKVYPPEK